MSRQQFKSILVGVDFSPYSKIVLKQAQFLSQVWKTSLSIVHAYDMPSNYDESSIYAKFPNMLSAETYSDRIKKYYKLSGARIKIIAKVGAPTSVILSEAKKLTNPLIVVGYKGHRVIEEFLFGSTAQRIALKSKAPVWIHRGEKVIDPKRVLVPHDLSRASDRSVEIANRLTKNDLSEFEIFHVNEKIFPILDYNRFTNMKQKIAFKTHDKIQQLIKKYPKIKVVSANGAVAKKIASHSKKFDLVVMTHHNPTGFMSRSETVALLKKVHTPVMVAH
jgi:nucleotide-binding universal stress UspA family protein